MREERYCKRCGAYIPLFADECLACCGKEYPAYGEASGDLINGGIRITFDGYSYLCYLGAVEVDTVSLPTGRTMDGKLQRHTKIKHKFILYEA